MTKIDNENCADSIKEYVDDLCVKATRQMSDENVCLDNVPVPVKAYAKSTDLSSDDVIAAAADNSLNDKEDEWMKVLGHNNLKKRVIRDGINDLRPDKGCQVTIRYTARLADKLDDQPKQIVIATETISFILGEGDVVDALDLTVSLMNELEVTETFTTSKYAYGELGNNQLIPPNATLYYEIELLKWCASHELINKSSFEDLCEIVKFKKQRGNFLYNRKENQSAINSYTKALEFIEQIFGKPDFTKDPNNVSQLNDDKLRCYNNMAAAQLKIDAFDVALTSCDHALQINPLNVKALFRKSKCFVGKGQLVTAIQYLKQCLDINPESKLIHSELAKYNDQYKEECCQAKKMYKKMLGDVPDTELPPTPTKKTQPINNSSTNTKIFAVVAVVIALIGVLLSLFYARD